MNMGSIHQRESKKMKVVIIGCGDIGMRVARHYIHQGEPVTGLVRSDESAERLRLRGITPFLANLDDPRTFTDLDTAGSILFYFAPPPGGGFTDTRARNFCAKLTSLTRPQKIVYLSTSGVYGDCGDKSVDEGAPAIPLTSRGKRRLDAEGAFLSLGESLDIPVVILRVTGIYGPGKLPYSQLQAGLPVLSEAESSLTNRIHAHDLAAVCVAAAEKGEQGDIFNVSDGHPTTMTHYFNAVADALKLPRPRQISREEAREVMPPLMLSYFSESRLIDNRKMLNNLGVSLRYPSLDKGLTDGLEESS
jgi:nucleoside-diphosphate-sugar epimerase